jgi:DNA-binding winged helix-turn-helix (wHTH) protein/TolB-like protein/Tfp pilus assembly protein PilF
LTPKALDVLLLLVRNPGMVVEKDRLLREVWAEAFVEEGSLPRTIHELRRALGDDSSRPTFIETITKRGYRFVAPVQCQSFDQARDGLVIERYVNAQVTTREREVDTPGLLSRERFSGYRKLVVFSSLAVLVSIAIVWGLLLRSAGSQPGFEIKTVAVLPLKSLDVDELDRALGLKLADALIQRLGRLGQVVVRPTRAVQKYDANTLDSVAAGREQQVDVVLDGTFQRTDRRLRLRVALLRVSDGQQLWESTFDERSTDPFYLEDTLAEQTAQALVPHLSGDERQLVARHDTENAEASRLYTEGRYYWNKRTEHGFKRAIEFFNQAIDKDPGYALAYAGLSDCYALLSVWCALPPNDALVKARAAALHATTIDQSLAEAHTSLAFAKWIYDRDWSGAEEEFRQAIRLNPHYPTAHHWYAYYLAAMERFDEAIAQIKQARDLDELSPGIDTDVGEIYCWARRYDQALEQLQAVLKNEPNFPPARNVLGMTYVMMGRVREGVAELEAARRLDNGPRVMSALGCAYGLSGRRKQARGVLHELEALSRQRYISHFSRALVHVGLGDKDKAFASLEGALNEHSDSIVILKVYPWLDSVRSDPRFTDLTRRIGLSP